MKFGSVNFLWMLLTIPLLVMLYRFSFKQQKKLINLFVSDFLKDKLIIGSSNKRKMIKAILICLIFLFSILALIRPKYGFHWEEVERKGVDIILALDVSKSMNARDVSPDRINRAKREVVDLLKILKGDRVGLIAFAGTAFLQTPLTLDYGAVSIFLDDLDTDLIPIPGTAIEEALKVGINSFDKADKKSRVLILITDGEDHQGSPLSIAKKAKKENIIIYTIGIGKIGGAPIPDSKSGGFKKDENGNVILTKLDESTLQKIALETGGSYVRSVSGDLDLESIYKDIQSKVEDKNLKSGKIQRFEERFQWPLFIAIVLLIFESFFFEKRKRNNKENIEFTLKTVPFLIFTYSFLSFLIFSMPLNASAQFLNSKTHLGEQFYNQGKYSKALTEFSGKQIDANVSQKEILKYNSANTLYKLRQFDQAASLYKQLSENGDNALKQKSFYNLGNSQFNQGKLKESIKSFQRAVDLNPKDENAKYNLEFARDELRRRLEKMKKQNKNRKQKKQGQSNNKKQKNGDKKQDQKNGGQKKNKDNQNKNEGNNENNKEDNKKEKKDLEKQKQSKAQKNDKNKNNEKKNKKDEKNKDKNKAASSSKMKEDKNKQNKKKMSPQDIEQIFSRLNDSRKKYIKQKFKNSKHYRTNKDW